MQSTSSRPSFLRARAGFQMEADVFKEACYRFEQFLFLRNLLEYIFRGNISLFGTLEITVRDGERSATNSIVVRRFFALSLPSSLIFRHTLFRCFRRGFITKPSFQYLTVKGRNGNAPEQNSSGRPYKHVCLQKQTREIAAKWYHGSKWEGLSKRREQRQIARPKIPSQSLIFSSLGLRRSPLARVHILPCLKRKIRDCSQSTSNATV